MEEPWRRYVQAALLAYRTDSENQILLTQPQPPPSFQPPIPRAAAAPAATRPVAEVKTNPDLITRYNLSSRVNTAEGKQEAETNGTKGWSQNKTERSEILKRRREEMVLAARRKMLEKDQTKAA